MSAATEEKKPKASKKAAHRGPRGPPKKGAASFSKKRGAEREQADGGANGGPANKKRALRLERRAHKPHAEVVSSVLNLWNQLRERTVPLAEKRRYINDAVRHMKGKYHSMAMKHDTSRAVQAVVMYGEEAQVYEVLEELKENFVEICCSQYAHFVVLKLLKWASAPKRSSARVALVRLLRTLVRKLAVHAVGCRVLETAVVELPKADSKTLQSEFYGKEALLANASGDSAASLSGLLELRPDRREQMLAKLWGLLQKLYNKGMCGFSYTQALLLEYLTHGDAKEKMECAALFADKALELIATRPGARAVALVVAYGAARERKRVAKSFKGKAKDLATHRDAYIALLRLLDATDDTVSLRKTLLPELFQEQSGYTASGEQREEGVTTRALLESQQGCKVFLWLLDPNGASFDPAEKDAMKEVRVPPKDNADAPESEWVPTSKKAPGQRREELLSYLREPLVGAVTEHADALLASVWGAQLVLQVAKRWAPQGLFDRLSALMKDGSIGGDDVPAFEHPRAHLAFKWLLAADQELRAEDGRASLAGTFAQVLDADLAAKYVSCNRGCFVLSALLKVDAVRADVRPVVVAALESAEDRKGVQVLRDDIAKMAA